VDGGIKAPLTTALLVAMSALGVNAEAARQVSRTNREREILFISYQRLSVALGIRLVKTKFASMSAMN